ncbi:hypothetical protein [Streptomyces sp. W4I9-2]|uniref:hypothetical protein n=1 Tax=Streptomyces sp. W4I9-2 TaxID=3042297 RepID=UPI0027892734|nr:hypothetical protein [Streptomyces sp. W4I9-2]MDQ0694174.1 hypothetical protein [Streptomyces sp. W4I9-2]
MTDDDRFRNEIISMTTAQPGWTVRARINAHKRGTNERWVEEEAVFPVVGWAVVACHFQDGSVGNRPEAVFLTPEGRLEHESYHRWQYSELEPKEGDPRMTVSFEIRAPSPA